mgnify:CR=1 FL=1
MNGVPTLVVDGKYTTSVAMAGSPEGLMKTLDELIVKAHLARLEAQDEWAQLEKQLEQVREKAAEAAVIAGDSGREVLAAAKLVGEEIARGYERLRKAL